MTAPTVADERVVDDLLERLTGAVNAPGAMLCLGEVLLASGIQSFIYGYSPSALATDGRWSVPAILTHNVPSDWDENVRAVRWADPYYHACFEPTLAVDWHSVQRNEALSPDQQRFLRGVADNQLTQGLTIPLHLPRGGMSFLSYLGFEGDREFGHVLARRRSLLFLLAYNFLGTMQARFLGDMTAAPQSPLGKRELECLRWSALGKSATDTGVILGISPETVRVHLKRAYSKLQASNRCNATAKAMQLGLINLGC